MRNRRFLLGASALVIALAISGCSHNLVADQGAKTVTVFMDEDVYKALLDTRQRIEDPNYNAGAKKYLQIAVGLAYREGKTIDGGTKVKILSSDSLGSLVEVEEGPYLGYKGFVPKENLR
jgi:hypothetical protein